MVFNTGAALLDAVVLAVVSREEEGTYGYKITQDVYLSLLKYLLKSEFLRTYSFPLTVLFHHNIYETRSVPPYIC